MEDLQMKVRDIAEIVGLTADSVNNILHKKLEIKKLCALWVPRLLTID